jgi:VanZ family protein
MTNTLKYYGLTILWALFVLLMCCIKIKVSEPSAFFPGFDKLVHCGFFFVFVIFYSNGIIRKHNYPYLPFKYALIVLTVALAFGGAIELLQSFVFTWRDGEWDDFFADSVGIFMAMYSVLVTAASINNVKK